MHDSASQSLALNNFLFVVTYKVTGKKCYSLSSNQSFLFFFQLTDEYFLLINKLRKNVLYLGFLMIEILHIFSKVINVCGIVDRMSRSYTGLVIS